jgi:hypothetical protein
VDGTEHYVKPDVVFLNGRDAITPEEARKGWRYLRFQERHAKLRYTCEACINHQDETAEVWHSLKKEARALEEKQQPDTYYNNLCN